MDLDSCSHIPYHNSLTHTFIQIPTTEELKGVIDDPVELGKINSARAHLRQLTEERVLIAELSFAFIDEHGKRIEKELAEFEV